MKRRRRRRKEPAPIPLHTYGWIHSLPDEAQLLVSERGKHIGTLDAVGTKLNEPLTLGDTLLAVFGPGRYTVMPVYDGKMHKAVCVPVGDPWEHGTRRRQRDENATRSPEEEQINSLAVLVDAVIKTGDRMQKQEELQHASKQASEKFREIFKCASQICAEDQKKMRDTFRQLPKLLELMRPPTPEAPAQSEFKHVILPAVVMGLIAAASDPRITNSPLWNALREQLTEMGRPASKNARPPAQATGTATQKPIRVRYRVPGAKTRRFTMPSRDAEKTTS